MENEHSSLKVDDDNLLNVYGPYNPQLDLASYCYPKMEIVPNELSGWL